MLATATDDYRAGPWGGPAGGSGPDIVHSEPARGHQLQSPRPPTGSHRCSSRSSLRAEGEIQSNFRQIMSDRPRSDLVNSGDMKSPNRGEGEVVVESRFFNRAARACGMRRAQGALRGRSSRTLETGLR